MGLSDVLDGWFARWMRRRHGDRTGDEHVLAASAATGAWLDPVCDKAFVISAFAGVAWALQPPLVGVLLTCSRELLLVPLAILYRLEVGPGHVDDHCCTAGWPGKATTVAQFTALGLAVLRQPTPFVAVSVLAAALGLVAVGYYVRRAYATPPHRHSTGGGE